VTDARNGELAERAGELERMLDRILIERLGSGRSRTRRSG
jgi:hypothetical protein